MVALWIFIACASVAVVYSMLLQRERRRQEELTRLVEERTAELRERTEQLVMANAALEELATVDSMTGISNRRRFDAFLQQEWQRSNRSRLPLSLLMLDIDHFKKFNDRYGHPAGDECIRQVVSVLRDAAHRVTDLCCRYGGEEFAIVMADTPADGAFAVAEFIRHQVVRLAIPHEGEGSGIVTVSVGLATKDGNEYGRVVDFIAACDRALYEAKNSGRNRTCQDLETREVAPAGVI